MTTYSVGHSESETGIGWKVFAVFAGFLIPFVIAIGAWLAISAHNASNDAHQAAASAKAAGTSSSMPGMSAPASAASGVGTRPSPSYAGVAPANADALAMRHAAFPATLPAAAAGSVAHVHLSIADRAVTIAPGIRYEAWTFGSTAPGPVIHVRQGQRVDVTLTNDGAMAHSVDFHAAEVAPNVAFADVAPGASKRFSFVASAPGVFMYHCGTAPAFMHIANGMYGAIIVEPKNMPPAQREYVLVSSEWYLNSPGNGKPAGLDVTKAEQMTPDWVTFNGYAAQYKTHPLTAEPGADGPLLGRRCRPLAQHRVPRRRDGAQAGLDQRGHGRRAAARHPNGGCARRRRRRLRRQHPEARHLSLRLAQLRERQLGEVGLLNVGNVAGTMSH